MIVSPSSIPNTEKCHVLNHEISLPQNNLCLEGSALQLRSEVQGKSQGHHLLSIKFYSEMEINTESSVFIEGLIRKFSVFNFLTDNGLYFPPKHPLGHLALTVTMTHTMKSQVLPNGVTDHCLDCVPRFLTCF